VYKSKRIKNMVNEGQSPAEEVNADFDYLFKIVLIGDAGVGKTAIVHRFKYNTFVERHASTIGVDFTLKTLQVDDKKIKLQIWDTAGQERFRTITQSYYRSANAVVLVYDITKADTFKTLNLWIADVKKYAGNCLHKMLIGNKCDLENRREVSDEEMKTLAEHYEIEETLETSAKENSNIEEAFWRVAKNLKDKYENESLKSSTINITPEISLNTKTLNKGCCGT